MFCLFEKRLINEMLLTLIPSDPYSCPQKNLFSFDN